MHPVIIHCTALHGLVDDQCNLRRYNSSSFYNEPYLPPLPPNLHLPHPLLHSCTLVHLHICALPTELPTCKHCTHCTHVQCIQHILLDANFFDKPYLHPMLLVLMTSLQVDPGAKGEVKSMLCKSIKLLWWCPSIQMHLQVSRCICKCPDAFASIQVHLQVSRCTMCTTPCKCKCPCPDACGCMNRDARCKSPDTRGLYEPRCKESLGRMKRRPKNKSCKSSQA